MPSKTNPNFYFEFFVKRRQHLNLAPITIDLKNIKIITKKQPKTENGVVTYTGLANSSTQPSSTSPDLPITLAATAGGTEDVVSLGNGTTAVADNSDVSTNNNNNMTNNNQQSSPGPDHSSLIILQPGIVGGSGYSSMQLPSFTHYQGKCPS